MLYESADIHIISNKIISTFKTFTVHYILLITNNTYKIIYSKKIVRITTSYYRGKFKTYCCNTIIILYKVHNTHYYTRIYNIRIYRGL